MYPEKPYYWKSRDSVRPTVLCTKDEIMRAAKEHRFIRLIRFDRELGKVVEDRITRDMPAEEIVV